MTRVGGKEEREEERQPKKGLLHVRLLICELKVERRGEEREEGFRDRGRKR